MAGNVCYHEGFAREAPAKPQPFQMAYQPFQTPYQAGPSTTKKATGKMYKCISLEVFCVCLSMPCTLLFRRGEERGQSCGRAGQRRELQALELQAARRLDRLQVLPAQRLQVPGVALLLQALGSAQARVPRPEEGRKFLRWEALEDRSQVTRYVTGFLFE